VSFVEPLTKIGIHADGERSSAMENAILALLEQHGSLGYEQIAAHLNQGPDAVRNALQALRDRGLVDVLSVGELEGAQPTSGRLLATDRGRTRGAGPIAFYRRVSAPAQRPTPRETA